MNEHEYMVDTVERVVKTLAQPTVTPLELEEVRIELYEALGVNRSDAQGIVEAENLSNKCYLQIQNIMRDNVPE